MPELEPLVAEEPLREERWRLLVLALYRAHRQADALAALRRARQTLADELGVDPGRRCGRSRPRCSPSRPRRSAGPAAAAGRAGRGGSPDAGGGAPVRTTGRAPARPPALAAATDDLVDRDAELGQPSALPRPLAGEGRGCC